MNWTHALPHPALGENIALQADGGSVIAASSQRQAEGDPWDAQFVNDGKLDTGWNSATGAVSNQSIKLGFAGRKTYEVTSVIIDPAPTHGDPSGVELKDFEIRVSTSGTADSDFRTVFDGICEQRATLQTFALPQPVQAKYVELVAKDNYGNPEWISVAELEVVGTATSKAHG